MSRGELLLLHATITNMLCNAHVHVGLTQGSDPQCGSTKMEMCLGTLELAKTMVPTIVFASSKMVHSSWKYRQA